MTMYRLAKLSGVPKTTVIDIFTGKSSIEKCNAGTVLTLAKALGCSMEDLMISGETGYNALTGLPKDMSYLEKELPEYLDRSLDAMKKSWEKEDSGMTDIHWDVYWSELNADINCAEAEQSISKKQAEYLRRTYLRMEDGL